MLRRHSWRSCHESTRPQQENSGTRRRRMRMDIRPASGRNYPFVIYQKQSPTQGRLHPAKVPPAKAAIRLKRRPTHDLCAPSQPKRHCWSRLRLCPVADGQFAIRRQKHSAASGRQKQRSGEVLWTGWSVAKPRQGSPRFPNCWLAPRSRSRTR